MTAVEYYPRVCIKYSLLFLLYWISSGNYVVEGGKAKSKGQEINGVQSVNEHIAVLETEDVLTQNYQGAVFIYPPGIRSERDIPVCTNKTPSEHEKDATEEVMMGDMGVGVSGDFGLSNKTISSRDVLVRRRDSSDDLDQGIRWESACNLIHNRYFFSPIVERLCRCPERTECPWEWIQPPSYPNAPQNIKKGTTSSQPKGSRDPFTVILSSRSQAKFCTEVTTTLPKCHHHKKGDTALQKQTPGHKNEKVPSKLPNMMKTLRKVGGVEEVPKVAVNCFCPPLFRQWNYVGQTDPTEFGNGTIETNYYYKCDKLPRCKTNDRCGNIRTDLHFSFYHCTCPRNHLCLPKVYPVESVDDVEEDVNEVLFKGQVAPAFCTPFAP